MKSIPTLCKFCKASITLEIDDDYAALNDPYGLIRLASCNRCADLRARRRWLHELFVEACSALIANPHDQENRQKAESVFTDLTKKYLRLIGDWIHADVAWNEDMVAPFMQVPKSLSKHLNLLWRHGNQRDLI